MQKSVPIILAVLAIIALCYLFMNNDDMTYSNSPIRSNPMNNRIENFAAGPTKGMPKSGSMPTLGRMPNQGSMKLPNIPTKPNKPVQAPKPTQAARPKPPAKKSRFEEIEEIESFESQNQQYISGSEEIQFIEQPQSLGQTNTGSQMNQLPSECYPKDVLSSVDLLPSDANSLWAQVNPSGQGSLADQNFLTSGFHIGINTVGQTLRNANRQLRSEPLNPQVKVSPWMQTTIDPDINRRPLEISSGDL